MDQNSGTDRLGLLQLLTGALLISFSSIMVKTAHVGPTVAAFYRVALGGTALLALVLIRRKKLFHGWGVLGGILAAAFLFFLDLAFWHHSIHYVGPGLATILANLQVFFLAGAGVVFFGQRLTFRLVAAICLSVVGLMMVVGPDWGTLGPDYRMGVWLGLITALCYATYLLTLRWLGRLGQPPPPLVTMAWVSLICALFMIPEVIRQGESWLIPDLRSWAALLVLGWGCHALGWVVISTGLPKVAPAKAGLTLLLQPTLAFIWDLIFFARPTGLFEGAGAVLTLAAIYMGLGEGPKEPKNHAPGPGPKGVGGIS